MRISTKLILCLALASALILAAAGPALAGPVDGGVAAITDVNGDGNSDIVIIQDSTGLLYAYTMTGTTISDQAPIVTVPAGFTYLGFADINGDDASDVIIKQDSTNLLYSYLLTKGSIGLSGQGPIVTIPGGFTLDGFADVNGDDKADVIIQQTSSGLLYGYLLNGTTIDDQAPIVTVPAGFSSTSYGDVDANKASDKQITQDSTGLLYTYMLTTGTIGILDQGPIVTVPGGFTFESMADIDGPASPGGTGTADVVISQDSSGLLYSYLLTGTTISDQGPIVTVPGGFTLQGFGDFNGDKKNDVLIIQDASGLLYTYLLDGLLISDQGPMVTVPAGFTHVGI